MELAPLTWISTALDYAIWGLNPLGYHLTNNILHAVNTFMVVILVAGLVEARNKAGIKNGSAESRIRRKALVAAAVAGLLFGLHPLHVESVAWVAERKDLLCAMFFLLSISSYMKYVDYRRGNPAGKNYSIFLNRGYLFASGFFALALLSKPMAVSLPLVLLILDWYPFDRIQSLKTFRTALFEKLPFFALAFISSILTIMAQKPFADVGNPSLSVRILVAFDSLVLYIWKMIVPLVLIPFYPLPRPENYSPSHYFLPVALVIGISAACLALAKRNRRMWLAAWCYYVITLLPVLGIVQVGSQAMADRYTYLPSLGPFLIAGVCTARLYEKANASGLRRSVGVVSIAATVFVFISLSYLTVRQIGVWRNDFTLWNYQIEKEPERVPLAYKIRGSAFYWHKGQFDNAIADFNKAIALDPSDAQSYYLRAMAYEKKGDIDRTIADCSRAIVLNPSLVEAYSKRASAYEKKGQTDKAIADLEKVVSLRPSSVDTEITLGVLYGKAGASKKAIDHFNRAIGLNPRYPLSYNDRGYTFFLSGRYEEALRDFDKAIELNKANANVYLNRGNLYLKIGNKKLAMSEFQKACDLRNENGCNAVRHLQ